MEFESGRDVESGRGSPLTEARRDPVERRNPSFRQHRGAGKLRVGGEV